LIEYEDSDIESEVLLVSYSPHEDTVDVELISTGAVWISEFNKKINYDE